MKAARRKDLAILTKLPSELERTGIKGAQDERLLFFPSRRRRLPRRRFQFLLAELLRPRRPALQSALAPQGNRCRVFRWPRLFFRRRADGLARHGFKDRCRALDWIEHFRFWSGSFCHACIMGRGG